MYIAVLLALGIGLIVWGVLEKERLYEFPFLIGVMYVSYLIPYLAGVARVESSLPPGAYDRIAIMAILCGAAVYVGYQIPSRPTTFLQWTYDKDRLFRSMLILTGIGVFASWMLGEVPASAWKGQATGAPVIVIFFAKVRYYALALSVFVYLKTRDNRFLLVALVCLYFIYPALIQKFRRVQIAQSFFIVVLAFWFCLDKTPTRIVAIPAFVVLFLFGTTAIGPLRKASMDRDGLTWQELRSIEWVSEAERKISRTNRNSTKAAAYQMAAIERFDRYDFGIFHWNRMVHKYVPGSVLGNEFEESLFIKVNDENTVVQAKDFNRITSSRYGFTKPLGTTTTGLRDAYGSFGYFGFIKFMLVAAIMKVLYVSARRGSLTHQLLYALLIAYALHIVSHNTNWFFERFPHMAIFLLPALWYARSGTRRP